MAFNREEYDRFVADREALVQQYRAVDIREAEAVLIQMEHLIRTRSPSSTTPEGLKFDLAMTLARRSEIRSRLDDPEGGWALMGQALELLRECPDAIDFALLTPRAVLQFIAEADGPLRIRWRQT